MRNETPSGQPGLQAGLPEGKLKGQNPEMRTSTKKPTRREFLRALGAAALGGLVPGPAPAPAYGSGSGFRGPAQGAPRIAVYAGPGTWREGREAIRRLLRSLGWESREVGPREIDRWDPAGSAYQAVWVPGGWAYDYKRAIRAEGKRRLRAFVARGGRYIGSCAGAYFASDSILWEGERYEYDLDLFLGVSEGPIPEIAPWPQWTLTPVRVEGGSEPLPMLYYGGQVFRLEGAFARGQDVQVVARWGREAGPREGEPAGIRFRYGEGSALLLGPHPEIGYDPIGARWDVRGGSGAQWAWLRAQIERLFEMR